MLETIAVAVLMFAAPPATRIQPGQLNPLCGAGQVAVLTFLSSGQPVCAALGTGLTLDTTTNPPTLRAAVATPLPLTVEALVSIGNLSWTMTRAPSGGMGLFRNGVFMKPLLDYTISGVTVTFTAAQDSTPADVVMVLYQ